VSQEPVSGVLNVLQPVTVGVFPRTLATCPCSTPLSPCPCERAVARLVVLALQCSFPSSRWCSVASSFD
jgi:hypothetical protein